MTSRFIILNLLMISAAPILSSCSGPGSASICLPSAPVGDTGVESVATVDGVKILKAELEREWRELPEAMRTLGDPHATRRRLLDKLIDEELLYREGLRRKLDQDPAILNALRRNARGMIADRVMSAEKSEPQAADDAALQTFYETHKDRRRREKAALVRTAEISVKPGVDPAEAAERCRRILSDVSGGKAFDEAATAAGATLSAEVDGTWITAGDARRELVTAVQRLRTPGELTPVLQSAHGCQVAKLIRLREAGIAPFDEVRNEVRASVERESRTANLRNLLKELRDKAKVEILEDAGGTHTAGAGKSGR